MKKNASTNKNQQNRYLSDFDRSMISTCKKCKYFESKIFFKCLLNCFIQKITYLHIDNYLAPSSIVDQNQHFEMDSESV